MPVFEHIATHQADAVGRLVAQYKGKPRMEGVAAIIGARAQSFEDALRLLATERTLDTAIGAQLDDLGAQVGEARQGKSDDVFRVYIRARTLVNLSSGTAPQLQELFDLLYSALGGNQVDIVEGFPASVTVVAHHATTTINTQELRNILVAAKAAGVRAFFNWGASVDAGTFTLSGAADADVGGNGPSSSSTGFGTTSDPATGGTLTGIMEA